MLPVEFVIANKLSNMIVDSFSTSICVITLIAFVQVTV